LLQFLIILIVNKSCTLYNHSNLHSFPTRRSSDLEESSSGLTRYIRSSELIARNTDAARTYYHYVSDEMGSTTHIVDEDGIVLNQDRKSTRLNSSHVSISYAVFCLKIIKDTKSDLM